MAFQNRVIEIVAGAMRVRKTVTPSKLLVDELGFDSIGLIELMAAIEDEFDMIISLDSATHIRSVGDLVDAVGLHLDTLAPLHATGEANAAAC
ncbi:acyl carrier protein [Derxia lacustris]|uniref:acyl carrier protein n=1 Tax=Derxia lacustris TaxID=764842 RepID=UPI00159391E9|nr:acyl carrier protein [Derxia lacustris]